MKQTRPVQLVCSERVTYNSIHYNNSTHKNTCRLDLVINEYSLGQVFRILAQNPPKQCLTH